MLSDRKTQDKDDARALTILDETLELLLERDPAEGSRITSIHLTPFFTVIEVDGFYLGAAMSYYRLGPRVQAEVESRIEALLARDPLLLGWLLRGQAPDLPLGAQADQRLLLETALRAAVASALSAPWLILGGDSTFAVGSAPRLDPFARASRALVVGFGGYVPWLAGVPHIARLDICDLSYSSRREEMDGFARAHERSQPGKVITLSDGHDLPELMAQADVLAITGSALSNGTMEKLLSHVPPGLPVVVQGQTAAIHPVALFRRGVHVVQTTLKPPALLALARRDSTGDAMRGLLEDSRLPWLCLTPR